MGGTGWDYKPGSDPLTVKIAKEEVYKICSLMDRGEHGEAAQRIYNASSAMNIPFRIEVACQLEEIFE